MKIIFVSWYTLFAPFRLHLQVHKRKNINCEQLKGLQFYVCVLTSVKSEAEHVDCRDVCRPSPHSLGFACKMFTI